MRRTDPGYPVRYRHHPWSPDALHEWIFETRLMYRLPYSVVGPINEWVWGKFFGPLVEPWVKYLCPRGYHMSGFMPPPEDQTPEFFRQNEFYQRFEGRCRCGTLTVPAPKVHQRKPPR